MRRGSGNSNGNGGVDDDVRGAEDTGASDDVGDVTYDDVERRALFDMADDEDADEVSVNVVGALGANTAEPAHDLTLGGYIDTHNRVPAFEGSDGQPYTVDIATDETGESERPYAAFLVFIRWAATGAGIMDHIESGDVASGATEEEAKQAAMELSLFEVKAELDAAIARRRREMED